MANKLKFWKWKLHWQILLGIGIGTILGFLSGKSYFMEGSSEIKSYAFIGDLFLELLKMLIVPLIAASMVTAMSKIGQHHNFARMGGKTILYYVTTSLIAILIGLVLVNVIKPGVGGLTKEDLVFAEGSQEAAKLESVKSKTEGRKHTDFLNFFNEMIPRNILEAGSSNKKILGVIFFSLLFGFFLSKLKGKTRETMDAFWDGFYEIMIAMTHFCHQVPTYWCLLYDCKNCRRLY